MARIHRLYRHLSKIDDESVDQSMAAALPTADPQTTHQIARLLLKREKPVGTLALVLWYHQLNQSARDAVAERAESLDRPLREAISHGGVQGTTNAIGIIQESGAARLTYLISEILRRGHASLRQEAAECLLEITRNAAGGASFDSQASRFLKSAVIEALTAYSSHEQQATLAAWAILCPLPLPATNRLFADQDHPAIVAMRPLLQEASKSEFRRAALPLAVYPALRKAALMGIIRCGTGEGMRDVLVNWHMLLVPAVRQGIFTGKTIDQDYLDEHSSEDWSKTNCHGFPAWIMALPLTTRTRLEALGQMRMAPDRLVRLGALRRLIDLAEFEGRRTTAAPGGFPGSQRSSPESGPGSGRVHPKPRHANHWAINEIIERYCLDPEPALAGLALRHLVRSGWSNLPKLLLKLVNADVPEVRRIAGDHLAPLGFDRYWNAWDSLGCGQRLVAGQALIKIDPCFHRHLADRLSSEGRADRLRALAMIHDLNQGAFFEQALLRLAQDDDPMIASSAIIALGTADSDETIDALEEAIDHLDARVRANALEALQELQSARHEHRLASMALKEECRPRANAIGHLLELRRGQAMQALRLMLNDERQEHRNSALWLVGSAGLVEVARHVAEMAITDPNTLIKRRASLVVDQLISAMKPPPQAPAKAPAVVSELIEG